MELYVLTQLGRGKILPLQKSGREEEANILKLLDKAGGVTVEQVAYAMKLDENTARDRLRSMSGKRWVWLNIIKRAPF